MIETKRVEINTEVMKWRKEWCVRSSLNTLVYNGRAVFLGAVKPGAPFDGGNRLKSNCIIHNVHSCCGCPFFLFNLLQPRRLYKPCVLNKEQKDRFFMRWRKCTIFHSLCSFVYTRKPIGNVYSTQAHKLSSYAGIYCWHIVRIASTVKKIEEIAWSKKETKSSDIPVKSTCTPTNTFYLHNWNCFRPEYFFICHVDNFEKKSLDSFRHYTFISGLTWKWMIKWHCRSRIPRTPISKPSIYHEMKMFKPDVLYYLSACFLYSMFNKVHTYTQLIIIIYYVYLFTFIPLDSIRLSVNKLLALPVLLSQFAILVVWVVCFSRKNMTGKGFYLYPTWLSHHTPLVFHLGSSLPALRTPSSH